MDQHPSTSQLSKDKEINNYNSFEPKCSEKSFEEIVCIKLPVILHHNKHKKIL